MRFKDLWAVKVTLTPHTFGTSQMRLETMPLFIPKEASFSETWLGLQSGWKALYALCNYVNTSTHLQLDVSFRGLLEWGFVWSHLKHVMFMVWCTEKITHKQTTAEWISAGASWFVHTDSCYCWMISSLKHMTNENDVVKLCLNNVL